MSHSSREIASACADWKTADDPASSGLPTSSKVKARFIDHNKFSPNHIKVITEAGTVFLMGLVTQREADAATDIARTTGGVQKVVRLFEIISEDAARRADSRPAEPAARPAAAAKPAEAAAP